MKPKLHSLFRALTVCLGPAIAGMSIQSAQAVTYYWDENGASAGFGTAGTVATNWSNTTSLFSTDSTGLTAPAGTQTSGSFDSVNFGTSTTGLAGGIVTVSGNPSLSNPTFGSANTGSIELAGGQLNLGTAASLTITSNALGNKISSVLIGGNSAQTLTITGGTITLAGANTFDRAIIVNGTGSGKLSAASLGSVGSASSNLGAPTTAAAATVNILGNGTLSYTGTGETTDRVLNLSSGSGSGGIVEQSGTGNLKFTGGVTSTGASSKTLTLQGSTAGTGEISGVIADNGGSNITNVSKTGSGTWTLSNAANTYSGKTSINGGALSVSLIGGVSGGASNLGSVTTVANGTIDMSGSGRLLYTGTGETTNRVINLASSFGSGAVLDQSGTGLLKFTGSVTSTGASSKTLTLRGSTAGTGEISGDIVDNGGANITSLAKTGSGTWTLSGSNKTYTGTTTVTGGKLVVNVNVTTSIVNVASGATIGGSGSLGGNLTVASGGIFAPGNSAGNLTLGNGLTLAGSYAWELAALSTANPGTDFDTVTVTGGSVDISGAAIQLTLGAFAPSAISFWQTDQTWAGIINDTGAGSLTGAFVAIDNSAWSSLGAFSTTNTGNDVNLVWTAAVPEPASGATLGLAGMLLMLRRRRSTRN